ncbi:MAG TPA: DUF2795 domain-containing protein [Candidatus Saccharimonadales bacterium]|nr:DUF2795 domain-containing protein [Candidatus Saccharimonadales bacterium]
MATYTVRDKEEVNPAAVMQYLGGVEYPAYKEDLMSAAQNNRADNYTFDSLRLLSDRKFHTAKDVAQELSTISFE